MLCQKKICALALVFTVGFPLSMAVADDAPEYTRYHAPTAGWARTRWGIELERFKGGSTDTGTQGLMVGLHTSTYLWRGLKLGLQFDFGAPVDGSIYNNNLTMAGASLGWDQSFLGPIEYDLRVLVGYGFGSASIGQGESMVLQPTVGLGFMLIRGYRVSFSPGYLYMSTARMFNGMTFSLRVDKKLDNPPSRPIDY